jgi:hypothetical protein
MSLIFSRVKHDLNITFCGLYPYIKKKLYTQSYEQKLQVNKINSTTFVLICTRHLKNFREDFPNLKDYLSLENEEIMINITFT